ncbi:MAG: IS1380 family transposase [bacterium]|nr:IS1380 family transposase [bacterium]
MSDTHVNNSEHPTHDVSPQQVASNIHALDIGEKTVLINFHGGFLSSDAGALLLREVEDQIGVIRKMAEVIPDSRDVRYITHSITDMVIQRVAQIACGYEDADDCDLLRHDPIFKMIAGRYPEMGKALSSQPTMSRVENSISRTTLYRLARVFADIFLASYAEEPDCIVLDFDDTDDPVHGEQQLALFNAYYKEHCFMPLHVYEGQSGKLVTTILKPGKRSEGKQMLAIMTRLITHLRAAWPNTMILVRGDSHFAYSEVMKWIETQPHVVYLTGLRGNARLKAAVQPIVELAQHSYRLYGDNLKRFYEFTYQADSWSIARRVVAKIELTDKGLNLRFVVTNIQGLRASIVYRDGYCPRGEDELYIKEHKLYLKSDRTSCSKFEANQFRVFLHSAGYVLLHSLKTNMFQHTPFSRASIQTIRLRVLKIGARIREWKTCITVELPTNCPLHDLLRRSFGIVTHLRLS